MKINWKTVAIALASGLMSAATVVWAAGFSEGEQAARLIAVEAHAKNSDVHMTPDVHRRLGRIEGYLAGIAERLGVEPPE